MKGSVRGKFSPASNKLVSAKLSWDTGSALLYLKNLVHCEPMSLAAAQAVANQAGAILDSLQMPCLPPAMVPSSVIVHSSSSSEGSTYKEDHITDESDAEQAYKPTTLASAL